MYIFVADDFLVGLHDMFSSLFCCLVRYPVESVEMMRRIIEEAETWRRCNPDLVLPDAAEAVATSEMEGIASAAVHAADSLSESW